MLDPSDKKKIQENFSAWLEIQDQRSALQEENSAVVANSAELLGVKKPMITKLFKLLKKKTEDGSDEIGELFELMEQVEN